MDGTSKSVNTNKGVASAPSKARGSLTENKDNANKEYPIHHSDDKDNKEIDKYSADARQFITFQTKNGKTFYLIINHDEDSENVMLLTEVSEDDLLNMVEKKEAPKQEVVKEETITYCYSVTVETETERHAVIEIGAESKADDVDSNLLAAMQGGMEEDAEIPEREYRQDTVRRNHPKIGRNDPCPCGSGKKYKNCCMNKDMEIERGNMDA